MTTPTRHPAGVTPSPSPSSSFAAGAVGPAVLGLKEAARLIGATPMTIRRRREALEAAGAVVTPRGWRIPYAALIEAELITPDGRRIRPGGQHEQDQGITEHLEQLTREYRDAVEDAAQWRERARVAEAREQLLQDALRRADRDAETLRMSLRMIEGTAPQAASSAVAPPGPTPAARQPSRELLGRLLGR